MITVREIRVCADCLIMIANGDASGIDDESRIRAVTDGMDRLTADGGHLVAGDTEYGFSWNGCECCCAGLGGDLYAAAVLTTVTAARAAAGVIAAAETVKRVRLNCGEHAAFSDETPIKQGDRNKGR